MRGTRSFTKCLLLILLAGGSLQCSSGTGSTKTTVGVLAPLTGEVASYGNAILHGIQLAKDDLNSRTGTQFELRVEDDQGNPRVGVTAARKLITVDKVHLVIGSVASSVTLAVAPLAEANAVLLLSPASSSPKITTAGDYIFRNYPSDTLEGALAANYAIEHHWSRAAVIVINNDYGTGLQAVFAKTFAEKNGTLISSDTFNEGTSDFRGTLLRIKNSSPDVLFLVGYGRELGTLARQARDLQIKSQILSTVNFHDDQTLKIGGSAVEGAIFTSPAFDPTSSDPRVQQFVKSFTSRYKTPPDVWSAHGYDAMRLVGEGCRATPRCSSAEVRDWLYQVRDWPGVSGITSFDSNGDVVKPVRFMTVRDGAFVTAIGR